MSLKRRYAYLHAAVTLISLSLFEIGFVLHGVSASSEFPVPPIKLELLQQWTFNDQYRVDDSGNTIYYNDHSDLNATLNYKDGYDVAMSGDGRTIAVTLHKTKTTNTNSGPTKIKSSQIRVYRENLETGAWYILGDNSDYLNQFPTQ